MSFVAILAHRSVLAGGQPFAEEMAEYLALLKR